jgi:hypothetical protein
MGTKNSKSKNDISNTTLDKKDCNNKNILIKEISRIKAEKNIIYKVSIRIDRINT